MRVLFFGDSITQGFWDTEGGWVQRIRKHYDTLALKNLDNQEHELFNLGVSGDTTRGLLARIENEIKARTWENNPLMVVIAIGTNDDLFEGAEQWVKPEEFRDNLERIIGKVRSLAQDIVLVGSPVVDESKTTPVSWGDFSYTNAELERSEKATADIAKEHNLPFVPIFEQFKAKLEGGQNLLADGLHPNDAGHQFIANAVLPKLQELLV